MLPSSRPDAGDWADIIGLMPEDIRIDRGIMEGHPSYEESGDSEIIPPKHSVLVDITPTRIAVG
jgi:hypothetical protein